jgi:hypothetical protein
MDALTAMGRGLMDGLILIVNGFLLVVYFLVEQLPLLLSLGCALLVALVFDPQAQRWTQFMPGRALRPGAETTPPLRQHQLLTGIVALLWTVASSLYPSPVPWLGLLMWLLTVLGLWLLPAERVSLLWRGKTFIGIYALALLAFRSYLALLGRASPEAWAAVIGSSAEAERVLASNRGLLTTIGFWVSCFALPAAQVVYLVQRLTTHPLSLLGPRLRPADIVQAIRTRGKDEQG